MNVLIRCCIPLLCIITAGAQPLNDSLSARLLTIKNKYKLAGISVSIIRDKSILATGSAGSADIARSIPVTDSTMYRIASISKTVAATALMQLYEQGKFSLDADVNPFIGFTLRNPNFPDDPITFRMLLAHTSGIVDGSGYNSFLSATGSNTIPPISSVLTTGGAYYTTNAWLNKKPGTYFTYTNLGFGVIGTLVERISGERFDRYCRDHIFKPLGIDASFNVNDLTNINKLAALYRTSGGQWVPQADHYQGTPPTPRNYDSYVIGSNGSLFGPQGNLRISAKDLALFMIARMNNGTVNGIRILNDSTAQLMDTPVWTYNGSNGNNYYGLFRCWGLGTHITTNAVNGDVVFSGRSMAGHPGEAYGLISDAYYDLNNGGYGLVFITNGKDGAYAFGSISAFYDVEEAVFAAAKEFITSAVTSVKNPGAIPSRGIVLEHNYPNPFNPATTILFTLSDDAAGRSSSLTSAAITIYDVLGREVDSIRLDRLASGRNSVVWNAENIPGGVYFYSLRAGNFSESKRMLLIK